MTYRQFLIRECSFLLLGIVVVFATAPAANARGGGNPLIVLFLAIILCLLRAGMAKAPNPDLLWRRRVASQVVLASALILLMLFEMGIGVIINVAQVPDALWLFASLFGLLYIGLSFVAHSLGGHLEGHHEEDEFMRDYEPASGRETRER